MRKTFYDYGVETAFLSKIPALKRKSKEWVHLNRKIKFSELPKVL